FANLLGLNISASFNSAVTIYILIPFLLIPQLIFSGVIVKFEELNPAISSQKHVPIIGELMASRWAFEALAVNQYKANEFEKLVYPYEQQMSIAQFKKVYWIPEIEGKIGFIENNLGDEAKSAEIEKDLNLIKTEIIKELEETDFIPFESIEKLNISKVDKTVTAELKSYLKELKRYYNKMYNFQLDQRDQRISQYNKS